MSSTITGLTAGNAMMTEQCLKDIMTGIHKVDGTQTYKLVLLDLSKGALTLTQQSITCYADISTIETTNTSGAVYTTGGLALTGGAGTNGNPVVSLTGGTRKSSYDFQDSVSLTNANFTSDAWAIINDTATGVGAKAKPVLAVGKFSAALSPSGIGANNFVANIPNDVINITANAAA